MIRHVRIAILGCRGIPARYGGFETFAEELSVRLVSEGFGVDVFCESDSAAPDGAYKSVGLVFVRRFKLGPLTTILYDVASFWKARKGYDIVYMLGYGASFSAFVPRLWGAKTWINMDGLEWARSKWGYPARQWLKMMEWVAMRTATRVVADADEIKARLQRRHGTRHPCSVIAYGAYAVTRRPDESILGKWGLEAKGYYLVVCRLEPENHVLEIIRGFKASASGKRLVIVGEIKAPGAYVSSLLPLADDRVRFIGTVFEKEAITCLRFHCYAYFHGHSVGGTNPSLLEAMGCGNLIIAHDNGFNREVLGAGGGFFRDEKSIPAEIGKIEQSGFDRKSLEEGARSRMESVYSWEKITREYIDLIRTEIGRPVPDAALSAPGRIPASTGLKHGSGG